MNKTCDFISSSLLGGGIAYFIGYIWFLLGDMNVFNAILMFSGISLVSLGVGVALVGTLVWAARHVRITIV